MLKIFRVKNYMSFREDSIIDFRATSYKQHLTHIHGLNNGEKLLKTIAIYGPNASGKSNLISAMYNFRAYILNSMFDIDNDMDEDGEVKKKKLYFEPFLLNTNKDTTEFEIVFIFKGKEYQYGFEYEWGEDRATTGIISEWYYVDRKQVFDRINGEVVFGKDFEKQLKSFNKVPKRKLYLGVLDYFLGEDKDSPVVDFLTYMRKDFNVFSQIQLESSVKGIAASFGLKKKVVEDKDYLKKVESIVKSIDVGITGLKIEREKVIDPETKEQVIKSRLKTIHSVYDENMNKIGEEIFPLRKESLGTLNFLSYIQAIIEIIDEGGIFVVDEISARLHPLLMKLIIDMFQSDINKKAQLLFTTHDISLLNNKQFRRDEIVFVDKNEKGESEVFALSSKKVREDATFYKDYLQGKYGAIPVFKKEDFKWGD